MIRRLLTNRKNWDAIAVMEGNQALSYRDLAQKALEVQSALRTKQGGNIAILLPNGGEYIAAFYGIVMSGMTAFPLNALMTRHEILPLLAQASVGTVLTTDRFRPVFTGLSKGEAPGLQPIYVEELPEQDGGGFAEPIDPGADKPMMLLSTSGTTGRSKIVQLSENNVAAAVIGYIDKMYYEETGEAGIRYILGTPYSSAYGMMILSVCLMKSFPIVLANERFTLDTFYQTVEAHRVTHYEGGASVVLAMEQLAGRPIPYDISSLRYMAFGGSKVSGETIQKLFAAYPGVEFYQGYGMTEASPLITKRPIKPNSVGTAITGVKIAVEANGAIVDTPYIRGEIVVKGPNVMLGYYENQEETDKTLRNGYLYTGDIGYLDEDGDLYICGRKKNIILVSGFNVHPEEVEECILHSALAKDCYVYGETDAAGNETVCADVVPMSPHVTAEQISGYCHDHLAGYKKPRVIHLCGEIHKTASGKTERARGKQ